MADEALKKSAALTVWAMQRNKLLPSDLATELKGKDADETVAILERMFRDPKRKTYNRYDATYDGIMAGAESFIDCAGNEAACDELRRPQTRNRAVIYENGKVREMVKR